MSDQLAFEVVEGEAVLALTDDIQRLSQTVFPDFTETYLTDRLARVMVTGLVLVSTRGTDGALLGFKLGYPRDEGVFYSWLGGIHPSIRRQGVGRRLMQLQHDWARKRGYAFVETRTRATNNAMIILNLQSGFTIVGYEEPDGGPAVVTQRAALSATTQT
jgi:predicted GNAT superfamily acetyltransferase